MVSYKLLLTVNLPKFPIHLAKTNNSTKANKMWKVNNQGIYSKQLNEFARAVVVENAHNYLVEEIKKQGFENLKINSKILISYEVTTVFNHGGISYRNGKTCWKAPINSYRPTWDIENLAAFWTKVGNDALSLAGVIIDDNVDFVQGTSHIFNRCDHIDDRIIKIHIYEIITN